MRGFVQYNINLEAITSISNPVWLAWRGFSLILFKIEVTRTLSNVVIARTRTTREVYTDQGQYLEYEAEHFVALNYSCFVSRTRNE
jgi:hypothetical protein